MRKHRCIYLQDKNGKALWCWQKGAKVKRSECNRCLLAYAVSGLFYSPKHKLGAEGREVK